MSNQLNLLIAHFAYITVVVVVVADFLHLD